MDAPKRIGLVSNGLGGWRLWSNDEPGMGGRDYPDAEYILATEHERIVSEKDAEIARLLKAISDIANWMDDPEGREHIGAVRGARSIARAAAIRALKESPDA